MSTLVTNNSLSTIQNGEILLSKKSKSKIVEYFGETIRVEESTTGTVLRGKLLEDLSYHCLSTNKLTVIFLQNLRDKEQLNPLGNDLKTSDIAIWKTSGKIISIYINTIDGLRIVEEYLNDILNVKNENLKRSQKTYDDFLKKFNINLTKKMRSFLGEYFIVSKVEMSKECIDIYLNKRSDLKDLVARLIYELGKEYKKLIITHSFLLEGKVTVCSKAKDKLVELLASVLTKA